MAQLQSQDKPKMGFHSIQLLKTQTIGIGSYGKICKAKCDDLLCAAKIIHETLFNPTGQQQISHCRDHRLPFRRFQQECEFMSAIRHPNIVQYLETYQDPETGLPVLLMELMDDSLTHFLERSQDPVPYHIQVNFCHDITLAISYLHSNGIIHRDLSSNNVLLYGNIIAKVTDFGMAKLGDTNNQLSRVSLTMVPGTDVYMPPEAVKNPPVYTAKIDCFAIGALIIQILTRQFPEPADRLKSVCTTDPQFPSGVVYVPAPEIERRQNHICQVDPNHPLLPIALYCLKDRDIERPSSQELCQRVAALKETPRYTESVRSGQERRPEQSNKTERQEQIRELIQQKDGIIQQKDYIIREKEQQIRGLQHIIGSQSNRLQETEQAITAKQHDNDHLRQQLEETVRDKESQLRHITQTSEEVIAQFQSRIQELEQQLKGIPPSNVDPPRAQYSGTSSRAATRARDRKASCQMVRGSADAAVSGNIVYFNPERTQSIYAYNATTDTWNQLPDCPHMECSLTVVNNLLTTIGGIKNFTEVTNELVSLNVKDSNKTWNEVFPPMPTKRSNSLVLCSGEALIVSGGSSEHSHKTQSLRTVEVMDIATKQWSTAAELPEPLSEGSATICGDRIYMLRWIATVYTCSLPDLMKSRRSNSIGVRLAQSFLQAGSNIWSKVADLPVLQSTFVTIHGQLIAIGGCDSNFKPTSDIRMYNSLSNKWEIVTKMTVARRQCFATVLANNQIMVVGGFTSQKMDSATDSKEYLIITIAY